MLENPERSGTERNGTEVLDAQYGRVRRICNGKYVSSSMYRELISRPMPATNTGQALSRRYRATPSVLNILPVCLVSLSGVANPSLQARGRRCHYRLWAQLWGVELSVAHPGTGREWYCVLYPPQIRNKHYHRASAFNVNIWRVRTAVGSAMRFY